MEFIDTGVLYNRFVFVRGVKKNGFYYYPNGSIKGSALFNSLGEIVEQTGFDEYGGIIKDYYFFKEPKLVGGLDYWRKYVGLEGAAIGIDSFGESAPAAELYRHFGITIERLIDCTLQILQR